MRGVRVLEDDGFVVEERPFVIVVGVGRPEFLRRVGFFAGGGGHAVENGDLRDDRRAGSFAVHAGNEMAGLREIVIAADVVGVGAGVDDELDGLLGKRADGGENLRLICGRPESTGRRRCRPAER